MEEWRVGCRSAVRIAAEVAEALASGGPGRRAREHADRPRTAARPQPRGRAGARGASCARRAPCPPRSPWWTAWRGSGSTTPRWRRSRSARRFAKAGVRDLAPVLARGGSAATTVAVDLAPGRAGGHPRLRHGRPGRRAPRGARELGRVGRPDDAGRHRHHRRLRGREVDPRRRRHARAARDAQRHRAGLRHATASRASTSPTPGSRCRGGSTRPEEVAAMMRAQARSGSAAAPSSSPTRCPRASRSIPSCTTACSPRRSRPRRRRAIRGSATTPFLLDRFHRETGGATLEANVALVRRNAVLAARIAARRGVRPASSSSATS